MTVKWSRETVAAEIRASYQAGEKLNYSAVARTSLLRAAIRLFGSWRTAIEFAGLDYDDISQYKSWTRERIITRIQELNRQGVDLSWGNISRMVDPSLASAATKPMYFGSWREAISAAGLDYDSIRRYRDWSNQIVLHMVRDMQARGLDLNAKVVGTTDCALLTAARRRFDSWHVALSAAGLDYRRIVLRSPFKRRINNRTNHSLSVLKQ
jgi:hypothetical protein